MFITSKHSIMQFGPLCSGESSILCSGSKEIVDANYLSFGTWILLTLQFSDYAEYILWIKVNITSSPSSQIQEISVNFALSILTVEWRVYRFSDCEKIL